jgi:hypothetical protein
VATIEQAEAKLEEGFRNQSSTFTQHDMVMVEDDSCDLLSFAFLKREEIKG